MVHERWQAVNEKQTRCRGCNVNVNSRQQKGFAKSDGDEVLDISRSLRVCTHSVPSYNYCELAMDGAIDSCSE